MFKLQRLEITGFKSFADYTEIVFTGSGITAVVGPNGCGKSNVSDSISWVLGEQRAKSLRGEDMKDVIFQGTSKRKPNGMAEVILHLVRDDSESFNKEDDDLFDIDETLGNIDENVVDVDALEADGAENVEAEIPVEENGFHAENVEVEQSAAVQVGSAVAVQTKIKGKRHWKPRSFALEFAPGDAVSVGRRLYLSGESEYLLNGKSCRLRDIQDLFAGTGLSGAHYALVEQGKIGQILSSKPSDRRNLIEEAAGISKFRTRQRATETRLISAKSNLSRISDIVSEIDKQANSLRRQASKTSRYKVLREEFRQLLRQTFSAEGRYLTTLVEELEVKLDESIKNERVILRNVSEKDEEFRDSTVSARLAEEKLSALRATHSENALERDRNLREKTYQGEQISNLNDRAAVLKGENQATEQRLKLIREEITRLQKDENKERDEAGKSESILRLAEEKYKEKLDKVLEIESLLESERAEILQHTANYERLMEIERQLETTLARVKERAAGLKKEGERAEETFNEFSKESESLEKNLIAERKRIAELQVEKQEILNLTAVAREALTSCENTFKDLNDEFLQKKNRLETLQELEEKRAIYTPTVQKLFADEQKIGVKFLGTLADRLNVSEKAEQAVENLFGGYLQCVLVESADEARKVARYLGDGEIGRNAILVAGATEKANKSRNGKEVGDPNELKNLLEISDELASVLQKAFPREMAAIIVENIDAAKSEQEIYVTFDGDLVIGGKLFVSGKTSSNEKNTSLLAFKRELRELETDSKALQKQIETAAKSKEKAREILAKHEDKLIDLQSFIVKVERELLSNEMTAKSIGQEIERAERHKKLVFDETKQIETEISEIVARRKEASENAAKADKARVSASDSLAKITDKLNGARGLAEMENVVLNEKRTLAATSVERRRSAQSALRRVENEAKELDARIARAKNELEEIKEKLVKLNALVSGIEKKISNASEEELGEQNELSEAVAHLKSARESSDAMSVLLGKLNKEAAEARNQRASFEIKQTEAITKLRSLNEKCQQDLTESLVELVEKEILPEDFELENSKARVEDLRYKLDNFGAINMLAVDELAKQKNDFCF